MRLVDLHPKWVTRGDGTRTGVSFACPVHAFKGVNEVGSADCALGRVVVPTEIDEPKRWQRRGDDFASMSLHPSVKVETIAKAVWADLHRDPAVYLTEDKPTPMVVHWHGWVKDGEVSIDPDSEAP